MTSSEGFLSRSDPTTDAIRPHANPGSISYIPVFFKKTSHNTSTKAPTITPAQAPRYVRRFQNSDSITTGPNDEPNHAHAFSTMFIIV